MRLASLKVLPLVAALALVAGCELDGASKKRADAADAASRTARAGRRDASKRMPPAETAARTNARAGAWTMLDGRRVSLEDFRGEAVVLDFYATYCPPCRDEIPHLVRLQKRFGPQGLKVVGLNVGGEEDQAKVPAYVRELGIQYQLANPDEETVDMFLAGNSAIPQTFVFDRQGQLVEHFVGFDETVAAQLERAVESALGGKSD
ncbi:MAG TPA: TlpA disulfide reductase family protein [Pyrinomonadaceae bacterium]|nr:TlpA disulfide reductase family protein [Pyrinomonadaceae bacterium]